MIIELLIEYLEEVFGEGLYIGVEAPEQLTHYILIDQTASRTENHITTTTLAIQTYGDTLYDAIQGNEALKSAMLGFLELDEVAGVRLLTDYNFTNTATKQYRWQAVFEITHYLGGF